MNSKKFEELDFTTQMALVIAMYIRNEMEDFHCVHLSDEQMKELNPIIRQAVYNIMRYIKLASKKNNDAEKIFANREINFHRQLIPDYWELPTEEAFRKDLEDGIKFLKLHSKSQIPGLNVD